MRNFTCVQEPYIWLRDMYSIGVVVGNIRQSVDTENNLKMAAKALKMSFYSWRFAGFIDVTFYNSFTMHLTL